MIRLIVSFIAWHGAWCASSAPTPQFSDFRVLNKCYPAASSEQKIGEKSAQDVINYLAGSYLTAHLQKNTCTQCLIKVLPEAQESNSSYEIALRDKFAYVVAGNVHGAQKIIFVFASLGCEECATLSTRVIKPMAADIAAFKLPVCIIMRAYPAHPFHLIAWEEVFKKSDVSKIYDYLLDKPWMQHGAEENIASLKKMISFFPDKSDETKDLRKKLFLQHEADKEILGIDKVPFMVVLTYNKDKRWDVEIPDLGDKEMLIKQWRASVQRYVSAK